MPARGGTTTRPLPPGSALTGELTSRGRWTTWAASNRCSTGSATSPGLTVVVYTLDETTYSRELAPLAGHYPALRLGPPWWFYDSPEGIRRFYQSVVETAGFANTVGFNDDARSLLSIPARHDVARRVNAGYLAGLVAEHRMEREDAVQIAEDLACNLARRAFRVGP